VNSETVSVIFDPPVRRGAKVWRKCRLPLACVEVIAEANVKNRIPAHTHADMNSELKREIEFERRS